MLMLGKQDSRVRCSCLGARFSCEDGVRVWEARFSCGGIRRTVFRDLRCHTGADGEK